MKTKDIGSIVQVNVSAREIADFNSSWPCADIPERSAWFRFERRNGDLVDMSAHLYSDFFRGDGNALNALSQDAKAFAFPVQSLA